ncbi:MULTISPECIES: substrate-binding domain-containing protein [unclassified Gilliamella]|uniref:substrate-binding domain-containing protein n=1 Tax=unclassified Gilliamella TaxID=2685620 RepID=UPI000810D294|nr:MULTISPECIES: substrate-binding domain-containing protein [Gilliamella]MCX8584521.1 substrate-binding domain-containing protein [Gilliamella sp. B3372]MCX8593660.1 substrate-binding domain-containing protein [Gilliamella sp. B3367]MCX8661830.1 substrate-binding domain-containing protein [Gilliamella sp. B2911]MCX8670158.1 substrate-binding domain-containing protein [Gilliamella sp. B2785]MCX8678299.1 substrate-binding domain-containing protein [Gilliamella sp. B2865]
MATIKDVAHLAKVSVATVSRVINNAENVSDTTRETVKKAMEKLSYYPDANARALSQQNSNTIGIVVADVSDPFFGAMVSTVEKVASKTGHFLLIGNGYHNEQQEYNAITHLIEHRCSSLVVHAKMLPDSRLIKLMEQVPGMVLINRLLKGFEKRCIALDDRYGSYLAVKHLIQHGHTKIGYLCSNHEISDSSDRLQGYKDALIEHNIDVNENFIAFSSPNEEGGEQAMMSLLERNREITAIACYNDSMAAGAMSVLYDNDIKIPAEISIIGFDDLLLARYLHPKLTTIRYPLHTMAEQAAELALCLAKGESPSANLINIYTPTLSKRYSVYPIE